MPPHAPSAFAPSPRKDGGEEEEEEDRREDTQTHRPHSHAMSDETRGWRISSREEEGGLKGTEDENRVEDGMNG